MGKWDSSIWSWDWGHIDGYLPVRVNEQRLSNLFAISSPCRISFCHASHKFNAIITAFGVFCLHGHWQPPWQPISEENSTSLIRYNLIWFVDTANLQGFGKESCFIFGISAIQMYCCLHNIPNGLHVNLSRHDMDTISGNIISPGLLWPYNPRTRCTGARGSPWNLTPVSGLYVLF